MMRYLILIVGEKHKMVLAFLRIMSILNLIVKIKSDFNAENEVKIVHAQAFFFI
jgi:hypothetical protein